MQPVKRPAHAIAGTVASAVVIIVAGWVRSRSGDPLDLPLPIWTAALALIGVGLITGGYLKKFTSPLISAEMEALPEAPQLPIDVAPVHGAGDWIKDRASEYARIDGYMLAHVYRPSSARGQSFDIFIFLARHRKDSAGPPRKNFDDIDKVEFFFGESWGNQVFTIKNIGGVLGVRTHAWGTFLATCRITFRCSDRAPLIIHRYIDFHMLQDAPEHA